MTQLVVDSSVAIKWFVTEPNTPEALNILEQSRNGAIVFLAPDFIYAEFGNIVWKKQSSQGLNAQDAQTSIQDFQRLRFVLTSTAVLLDDAYQIAATYRRTVYDSLYLALSLRENCQFVTADQKLINALGSAFPNVVGLAGWT
ncbi:MAG: type II toxin-antitoxin system VapC family toxin [Myxacorys californica WJT36-NPBG1]|jgi:predicted nucleic acid-binding protein|nr:type II toxin-antitoxin system VapC family toxin [Myxacorys californica WJT36-NPBG1]